MQRDYNGIWQTQYYTKNQMVLWYPLFNASHGIEGGKYNPYTRSWWARMARRGRCTS